MSTDRILSMSAILIAFCAVGVSVWQGLATREHNRLSLAPYIISSQVISGVENKSGIYVSNGGTGTAFIKKAYVIASGKTFDLTINSWPKIYKHLGLKSLCHHEAWFKVGAVITPGDSIKLIAPAESTEDASCPIEFVKLLATPELDINIIYESSYKEEIHYTQRIGLDSQEIENLKALHDF